MNETPGVGDEPIMGPDLVNGPNPWLPAYGFQIQHQIHASLQSAHEDLRANDTMLVQQVDYLETILEETSDDLQSDSDRSGTTYWLGSDSETESVIHIKTNQRLADDKLDGSGSETNSVVPKKRRRKNDTEALESSTTFGEEFAMSPRSPRSSRSSESSRSSRSSSLVQFESLERTCATLSPSSFSFDSLEYANRTNLSRLDTTSPDSLEQDYDRVVPNGYSGIEYTRIRPYRSFESLDTVGQKEDHGKCNGFVPSLFSKRNEDLSDGRRNCFQKRNVWRSDDYDDEDDYDEEDELSDEDGPRIFDSDSFKDRLLVFGDSSTNYATSLDCRNTTDLREIGLESKQDAFLELKKSGRSATPTSLRLTKLNITGNMAPQHQHRSDESGFNFSAMDKSQSAPSLALGASEFAARQSFFSASSRCLADVRRVASAPDLESYERDDEEDLSGEMSETMTITLEEEPRCEPESRTVRTQELPSRSQIVAINDPPRCEEEDDETRPVMEEKPVTSTVRTQDRIESVLEMVLDNDLSQEIVNNLAREVQRSESGRSRKVKNNASYELAQQLEVDDRVAKSLRSNDDGPRATPRKKMVNNASYELAQQCDYIRVLQSKNFRRMDACEEEEERPLDYTRSAGNISNTRPNNARVYSKSTDNVSQEGLIAQIKKNSDLFSLYGENGRPLSGPVEDDVDFCCLETKPIEKSESLSSSRPSWRSGDEGAPEEASPQGDRALKGKGLSGLERGVQASPPERASQRERLSSNPTAEAQHGDADSSTEASPVRADMSAAAARRLAKADSSAASSTTTLNGSERKKTGFGGFLQRFSKLRFSGRSKVPRSELHKKSAIEPKSALQTQVINKKEPDYIIIPLHPPEEDKTRHNDDSTNEQTYNVSSANGRPPVYSKPPLPPQPPRLGALAGKPLYVSRRRAVTDLGNPTAIEMAKARTMQVCQDRPVGLLETDLDAPEEGDESAVGATSAGKKTRSLLNLNQSGHPRATGDLATDNALHVPQSPSGAAHRTANDANHNQRPHKSMEFLLDKENLHFVKPPENELQKVGERVPSEHELRVQRSLQRLNVPDWYKNSPAARDGFRLKRHSDASQHSGWRALGSKTTSLSSLSSSSTRQPTTATLLSPSPTPPVFSRWSTSLLNSAGNSPANSARSSFNHRQPYLGWRSQERLTNPRTPAERLAQGLLQSANKQQQTTNQQQEVRNSIKEVTSAIVHYVQSGQESVGGGGRLSPRPRPDDWDERGGARSTSPRGSGKLCWMESSFVGSRPVDSPETPMSLATEAECCTGCSAPVNEPCSCVDSSTTSALYLDLTPTQDDTSLKYLQGSGSLCLSPSSNYQKHHRQQHHHHHHHQQSQQQHHRGELLLA